MFLFVGLEILLDLFESSFQYARKCSKKVV